MMLYRAECRTVSIMFDHLPNKQNVLQCLIKQGCPTERENVWSPNNDHDGAKHFLVGQGLRFSPSSLAACCILGLAQLQLISLATFLQRCFRLICFVPNLCCCCVHSLFSMEATSIFYSEEDDLRSWFYSKHVVEQERQEHIKRLREQGIIIPEEELVEEKGAQLICSLCP